MDVFALTDIGVCRYENQDRVQLLQFGGDSAFAVICDGMGGENAGGVASGKAIKVISERVENGYRDDGDDNSVRSLIIDSVKTANAVVYDIAESDEELSGMGTTCVAVLRRKNHIFCANVGDSRAYVIGDDIKQITKDHTLVMSMYESGEITKDELRTNPKRNYLTKAVGVSEELVPDYFEFEVEEDALILLCSDGLYGNIDDDVILRTVKENHGEKIPRALVECALINGSTDNVTAAVIFPENYT